MSLEEKSDIIDKACMDFHGGRKISNARIFTITESEKIRIQQISMKYGLKEITLLKVLFDRDTINRPLRKEKKKDLPYGYLHCTKCDTVKTNDEFHRASKNKSGFDSRCKVCRNRYQIEYLSKS
jgi:hypothetical protein